jgi:hypothetical protein
LTTTATTNPELLSIVCRILRKACEAKYGQTYAYHGTQAPWIQLSALLIMEQLVASAEYAE